MAAEDVARRMRRAGFALGALLMFAGLGCLPIAFTLAVLGVEGPSRILWVAVGLLNLVSAWWINAFSDAIAEIVQSFARKDG